MQKTEISANQIIWFDETLLKNPEVAMFTADYWKKKDRIIGSATGRGTTWFIQTDLLPAALRHYRRGGLFGKLVADSYWFTGWEQTRSYQELRLLNHLIKAGVNVPRPIAAQAIKQGLTYQADLISEKIAEAEDLVAKLVSAPLSEHQYHSIGVEIAKMHCAQVNHTDLNIHNILLDSANKVWIIDFDKCAKVEGDSWKQSNMSRLKRSFIKEVTKRNIHWQESDFNALLAGYHSYKEGATT